MKTADSRRSRDEIPIGRCRVEPRPIVVSPEKANSQEEKKMTKPSDAGGLFRARLAGCVVPRVMLAITCKILPESVSVLQNPVRLIYERRPPIGP
jgi:hypothetical protein